MGSIRVASPPPPRSSGQQVTPGHEWIEMDEVTDREEQDIFLPYGRVEKTGVDCRIFSFILSLCVPFTFPPKQPLQTVTERAHAFILGVKLCHAELFGGRDRDSAA